MWYNQIIGESIMSNVKIFEDKKIRTQWNEIEEDWYFSVVDVVEVLTGSKDYQNSKKLLESS